MLSRFVLSVLAALALAAPAAPRTRRALIQKRQQVREMAREALASLYEVQLAARSVVDHAAGYAVFSTFGIKIFFAGGTTGSGVVVNHRTHRDTFMKMVKVQAGLGFGASKDRMIFVFETANAIRDFVNQGWDFGGGADVSAMVRRTRAGHSPARCRCSPASISTSSPTPGSRRRSRCRAPSSSRTRTCTDGGRQPMDRLVRGILRLPIAPRSNFPRRTCGRY